MAKKWAKSFYRSSAWQKCRTGYIALRQSIDGGLCELCHRNLGYIVHHKSTLTPETIANPDIALNYDMLQYVCHECHNKIDHFSNCGYIFGDDGQIIPVAVSPLETI